MSSRTSSAPAHPRSRGENPRRSGTRNFTPGSSPLTRGKQSQKREIRVSGGLIPAHAGKTLPRRRHSTNPSAHPRSRGENSPRGPRSPGSPGSSPLTRGKRSRNQAAERQDRLIPAHAGKTIIPTRVRYASEAHPRSRGENAEIILDILGEDGSSPLTRGKHFPTCAFTAQIDQILETLELAVSSGSYSVWVACATDAPQDQVRSIGLVLPSSRGAS